MGTSKRGLARSAGLLLAIATALLIPPAANAAVTVFVTPTPASLPAPGGNVVYTVNVNSSSATQDFCFDCPGGSLESLSDSVYGDLNGKGTCSVSPTNTKPFPYACTFTAPVTGAAGTVVADAVLAGWVSVHSGGPFFPPDPRAYVRGSAAGAGAVLLTAPAVTPPNKCKKGFVLKKVKTKHGTVKKCVKKKKK
jgi:hypothetical protein